MKNIAFIPARGGSTSITFKNIKLFNSKPLIYWSIQAAKSCPLIDSIVVSTDSNKIAEVAKSYGALIHHRSQESATNTAPTETCVLEFAQENQFENMILIQATSPMITSNDLYNGISMIDRYDSILSVVESKRFLWKIENNKAIPINYDPLNRLRRQDIEINYVENGAFYVTKQELLLKNKCRISGKIGLYVMPQYTYFELDEIDDWNLMEKLQYNDKSIQYPT